MKTIVRKIIVIGSLVLFGVMSFAQESKTKDTDKVINTEYFVCEVSSDGKSLEIKLKSDYLEKKLVIPATIKDYPVSRITIEDPLDSLKEIVFPDVPLNVQIIHAEGLTKLTIPQVLNLEELYLWGCNNLKELELGKVINPRIIRKDAFYYCGFESFTVPEGVEVIRENAFSECKNLKSILLPSSVKKIERSAFSYCKSLKSIILPELITNINSKTFYRCSSLEEIVIPEGVEVIGEFAFFTCKKLKFITLTSVKKIEEFAFYNCKNLKSITLPKSITTIDDNAFADCSSLEEIIIPETVTKIDFEYNAGFSVKLNSKTQARLRELGYTARFNNNY